jgi:hypothetical protein
VLLREDPKRFVASWLGVVGTKYDRYRRNSVMCRRHVSFLTFRAQRYTPFDSQLSHRNFNTTSTDSSLATMQIDSCASFCCIVCNLILIQLSVVPIVKTACVAL